MSQGGKGGARHFSKPYIDPGLLYKCLKDHEKIVQDVGPYETISRNQAIDCTGIVKILPLVHDLVGLANTCEINPGPLRQALLKMVMEKPDLNKSKYSGNTWCSLRAERIGVILTHFRKMKTNLDEVRRAAAKLTSYEFSRLQDTLEDVSPKETALTKGGQNLPVEQPKEDYVPKRRRLKKGDSDPVSVDSTGWPKCLMSPEKQPLTKWDQAASSHDEIPPALAKGLAQPSFLRRRLGSKPEQSWKESDQEAHLQEAMGLVQPKAMKKKKKQDAKKKEKLTKVDLGKKKNLSKVLKKPAKQEAPSTRRKWRKLRVTEARNPERSYITGCHEACQKLHLIVEVSRKRTVKYREVIGVIKRRLEDEHLSKEEAIALRNTLC